MRGCHVANVLQGLAVSVACLSMPGRPKFVIPAEKGVMASIVSGITGADRFMRSFSFSEEAIRVGVQVERLPEIRLFLN